MKSFTLRGSIIPVSVLWCVVLLLLSAQGCSRAELKATANATSQKQANTGQPANSSAEPQGATIPIDPNGPADTVRAFYRLLREHKFREAMFLTNLKPAIQSLTDDELKEFSVDFESMAGDIPAEVEINGEITTGNSATVTVKLPAEDSGENETQPIKLRKEGDVWVIMTADEKSANEMKREGKDYLFNLRIQTHESEARKMLERISKAEMAYSLQNGGAFADMPTLVSAGLLPEDIRSSETTGYNYSLQLVKNQYTATATPAVYNKSGRLSFMLYLDNKGMSHVKEKDNRGQPLR